MRSELGQAGSAQLGGGSEAATGMEPAGLVPIWRLADQSPLHVPPPLLGNTGQLPRQLAHLTASWPGASKGTCCCFSIDAFLYITVIEGNVVQEGNS